MPKRRHYNEDWLVVALAAGKESHAAIARQAGLSPSHVWRIAAGRTRSDLQPRIAAARAAVNSQLHRVASQYAAAMLARHVKLGFESDGETARKCREFVISQAFDAQRDAESLADPLHPRNL